MKEKKELLVGIELHGSAASNRGRAYYLLNKLNNTGYLTRIVDKNDYVDIRIIFNHDFKRIKREKIRIFDTSDAITIPPAEASLLLSLYQKLFINPKVHRFISECSAIVVASEIQKQIFNKLNNNITVIPDVSFYHKKFEISKRANPVNQIIFVWDGQGHNYKYLDTLITKNLNFFKKKDVLLKVITDKITKNVNHPDIEKRLISLEVNSKFVEWNEDTFIDEVNSAHVGLAPVNMKCAHATAKPENKLVNYLGLALPVIASSIHAYTRFAHNCGDGVIVCQSNNDWARALEYWRIHKSDCTKTGLIGRSYVLKNYSPDSLCGKWIYLLDQYIKKL